MKYVLGAVGGAIAGFAFGYLFMFVALFTLFTLPWIGIILQKNIFWIRLLFIPLGAYLGYKAVVRGIRF